MKIGSIVECINDSLFIMEPRPKLKQPYTVSWIGKQYTYNIEGVLTNIQVTAIQLEELNTGGGGFDASAFRELLPPMEIQDALDSCEPVLIELNKK